MDTVWDGITRTGTVDDSWSMTRLALADAARGYAWKRVFG